MSKGTREVVLRVPEETAEQIERLEKKPLAEVLVMVWDRYLSDGRRTTTETKNIPVSWPLDWYEKMQTTWGRGMIPHEVRKIIQADIDNDKKRPLSPILDWKDIEIDKTPSHPKPLADRQSYIQPVMVPMDWYVRLLEKVGDGWVSTYIKFLVWDFFDKHHGSNAKKKKLSVPQRLHKFIPS